MHDDGASLPPPVPPMADDLALAAVAPPPTMPMPPGPWEGTTMAAAGWPPPAPPSRSRRWLILGLAAGVAAVMALSALLVVALPNPSSAEAVVINSVHSALADRTAHMDMSVTVDSGGQHTTGSGSGVLDFTQNAMQLHLDVAAAGQQVGIDEVLVGQTLYMGGDAFGSLLNQQFPGKSWLSLDLGSIQKALGSNASSLSNSTNPAAMLRLLEQRGNTVVALGPSTVNGTAVQGYAVTFDPAKMRAELQSPSLPSWIRDATSQVDFAHVTMKVYVDGGGLLRRWTQSMRVTTAVSTLDTTDTMDFSDYGAALQVSAPPPDQVLPFDQFLQSSSTELTPS